MPCIAGGFHLYMLYFPHMQPVQSSPAADAIKAALRFPLWWYTAGVRYTAERLMASIRSYARSLAVLVWVRNWLTPMFGQYDWQSRLISFIVRSAQIVARGFVLCVWIALCALQFAVYLALPVVAGILTVYHLFGALFSV